MAKFFWGSSSEDKRIHWTKWDNICYPIEEGGLDIKNLRDVTAAFSHKLWWRLKQNNSLWASFILSKYCRKSSPVTAKAKKEDSSTWKRPYQIRNITQENIFWSLGAGYISFWHDWWIPEGTLHHLVDQDNTSNSLVKDFWRDHTWDINKLQQEVPQQTIDIIVQILINFDLKDHMRWKLSSNGAFTTKSAWELTKDHRPYPAIFKSLWSPLIRPTISIFAWKPLNNWTLVDNKLKQKVCNAAKHEGSTFKPNLIIYETLNYLQLLHKAKLFKKAHWKGDRFTTFLLKIPLPPKEKHHKLTLVHWKKPPMGWLNLTLMELPRAILAFQELVTLSEIIMGKLCLHFKILLGLHPTFLQN
ncbi:UNVERIFIED_CONTAM: hypothetical protein Slati_2529000 [Sesamum latifolium]|uniref:Reverse transcriptase zinc-binding domain-containing protein n=1 Tax=Sesamum latifolium TaxID=2727402 RepID=A0AAW2WJR4_9LAMI